MTENSPIIKAGDMYVAKWGATMFLATFVEITRVSGSRVYYRYRKNKTVGNDGYGQPKVVPDVEFPSSEEEQYSRLELNHDTQTYTFRGPTRPEKGTDYRVRFQLWDGRPITEDHND